MHLVALGYDQPDLTPAADALYQELQEAGLSVLLDDRVESAGVKLNDADLLGLPLRVTLGPRGLRQGEIELRWRATGETQTMPLEGAGARVAAAHSAQFGAPSGAPPETGTATR